MIAVIADDLTGAAELAGIGLRFNLKVEINTDVTAATEADVLVISTDTRSMNQRDAELEIERVTHNVSMLNPSLIFKKIDSVLRGHVVAEIRVQLNKLKLNTALIVPANPFLYRTIKDKTYYVNNLPIHLSSFATDPEFPVTSSNIADMLRVKAHEVHVKKIEEGLPEAGIVVGEATNIADIEAWASVVNKQTLLCGGAAFYTALLAQQNIKQGKAVQNDSVVKEPLLFVCGTTFQQSVDLVRLIKNVEGPVSYMPVEIIRQDEPSDLLYEKWRDEIISLIAVFRKAIIAIDPATIENSDADAAILREKTACIVNAVFKSTDIHELIIEGGSTAFAIIKKLGYNRFFPVQELSPGVIRMSVAEEKDLHLTVKPGSYPWPLGIWNF